MKQCCMAEKRGQMNALWWVRKSWRKVQQRGTNRYSHCCSSVNWVCKWLQSAATVWTHTLHCHCLLELTDPIIQQKIKNPDSLVARIHKHTAQVHLHTHIHQATCTQAEPKQYQHDKHLVFPQASLFDKIRQICGRALRFMSPCICDVHFKSKQSQCIWKPPTEYRFPFYLNPFKGGGLDLSRKEKIGRGESADEISIEGLFHKRQNFLFCVSHLILSNMPQAIRPRAHCLKNAPFMRISPLFKQ